MNIKFPKEKKDFLKKPNLPLRKGFVTCHTCHDPQIQVTGQRDEKKKNPNFLRIAGKKTDSGGFDSFGPPGGFGGIPGIGRRRTPDEIGGNSSSLGLAVSALGSPMSRGSKKNEKSGREKKADQPLCFECHIIENYTPFNPHVQQLNAQGKVNQEICLICHIEVPNRWILSEENFRLRRDIAQYCIGCHRGKTASHPAEQDHHGKYVKGPYESTYRITTKKNQSFLPLKEGEIIVCPTCHNPHETETVMDLSAQAGGDATARLRITGKSLCTSCHFESRAPKKVMTPF